MTDDVINFPKRKRIQDTERILNVVSPYGGGSINGS